MRKNELIKLVAGDMIVSDSNRVYYVAEAYENCVLVKWNFKEDEFKELKKSSLISHYEIMSEEEATAYLDVVNALIKYEVGSKKYGLDCNDITDFDKHMKWEIMNQVYVKDSNDQLCRAHIDFYEKVAIGRVYSSEWEKFSLHQLRGYTLADEETTNKLRAEAEKDYLGYDKERAELEAKENKEMEEKLKRLDDIEKSFILAIEAEGLVVKEDFSIFDVLQ